MVKNAIKITNKKSCNLRKEWKRRKYNKKFKKILKIAQDFMVELSFIVEGRERMNF